jgi:hypothetical protein
MRYWLDTEFIESGPDRPIELLSIGIVAEDGREFYAENASADLSKANDWVREHVIRQLICVGHVNHRVELPSCPAAFRSAIALAVQLFCDREMHGKPEFWGYYADYDWVVLCQLFGSMVDLPKGWPMYCRDIKQWADDLGNPPLPELGKGEHHALADAKWNRQAWEFLAHYKLVLDGGFTT